MKKLVFAALAASLVATPVMAAPQHNGWAKPAPTKVVVKKTYKPMVQPQRKWKRGERFDARQARNYRKIDHRRYRHLKAPPRGYHYVQSGNDAVLVGIASGIIAAVIANIVR